MKNWLIIPFFIVIFILGFYSGIVYYGKQAEKKQADLEQGLKSSASLMVDYGDGKIKTFNRIAIANGATVFSVIKKISEENGLVLSAKDYGSGMGAFIEAIDSYANDYQGDKYWQFWVNNEYAKIGAGSYALEGGEVVEWKYVKGQVD